MSTLTQDFSELKNDRLYEIAFLSTDTVTERGVDYINKSWYDRYLSEHFIIKIIILIGAVAAAILSVLEIINKFTCHLHKNSFTVSSLNAVHPHACGEYQKLHGTCNLHPTTQLY